MFVTSVIFFFFFFFFPMLAVALVQLNVVLSMGALCAFFFLKFFYLGALIYKGFFFGWGLKRRLNSPKGWAGLG